jgi:predicted short-subunit dehydrogenase-like oxidoreductase (DUF2520 family)
MSILSSLFAPTQLAPEGAPPTELPKVRRERVLVVGAGPVGHALASCLERVGYPLRHWSRSQGPLWQESATREPADIVVFAVRDEAIAQAAQFIVEHGAAGPTSVLLHCAGALAPEEAFAGQRERVAGIGLLHPLRSFAPLVPSPGSAVPGAAAVDLTGTVLAVGGDEPGLRTAEALAQAVGGIVLRLPAERLPAYHAAAVLAAGHVAALLETAVHLLRRIGLEQRVAERALASLTRSVVDNIAEVGLPQALTGPFARGDAATVGKHLEALARISCEVTTIYRTLGYTAIDMAHHKGTASPESLDRIRELLDASEATGQPPR